MAKSLRVTVHVAEDVQQFVTIAGTGRRSDGSEGSSWSARVSELAGRMQYIVRACLPEFTRAEWCAIFDANNGGPFPECEPELIKSSFWANVQDARGLAAKWQVDTESIVAKLQAMTPAQSIAIGEAARFFWDNCHEETDWLFDQLGIA